MDRGPAEDATRALMTLNGGDPAAAERLLPLVYDELRRLAGAYFRGQPADHTLQPTALVHEAYMRLINQPEAGWNDRMHFFAVAATAMRQILIGHAEKRAALKRGGDRLKLTLDVPLEPAGAGAAPDSLFGLETDLLRLDAALRDLAALDERKGRIVELRFFAGLGQKQIADILGISVSTVEADWRMARAWLLFELREDRGP